MRKKSPRKNLFDKKTKNAPSPFAERQINIRQVKEMEEEMTSSELRKLILSLQKQGFTAEQIVKFLLEMTE